jgi:hypothetical protein
MRKLMKNTNPSVPSSSTIIIGPLKIAWPNGVSPVIWPAASVTAAALKVNHDTTPVSATAAAM